MGQHNNAKNRYNQSFNTNLITIIVSAIAIAVLVALLVPTLITLNNQNSEIENFNKQIEALKDQIAGLDTTDGITAEELEEALGKIEIPEGGLTEEQVKDIIEAAIAGIAIPEAGLTEEEIRDIITEALKGIDTGLTEEQVKDIIEGALEDIDTGLTKNEVKDIINAAVESLSPGLTEEQIKDIIDEVLGGLETGLTEEEIKDIIDEVLGNNSSDLKSLLTAGGYHTLTEDVAISNLNIARGITTSLDLNGYTLTVNGDWKVYGNLTLKNGNVVISKPSDETSIYMYSGICVGDDRVADGTLNFNNITVTGKRLWNVINYGNLNFINSKFVVEGGYGIANGGEAVVENCELVANGVAATQIYTDGGTLTVKNTKLYVGANFIDYYYSSAIEANYGSKITLEGVIIESREGEYAVSAGFGTNIVFKSGSISGTFLCLDQGEDNTCVTIYGGTINGVEFADITEDSNIFAGAGCKLAKGDGCWVIKYQK